MANPIATGRFKVRDGRIYTTVVNGDTLSQIAVDYRAAYGTNTTYQTIAAINDIADANRIYPGDIVYTTKATTTPSTQQPAGFSPPTITRLGTLANDQSTIYAEWRWTPPGSDTLAEYDVEWKTYKAGVWVNRKDETVMVDRQVSEYPYPSDGFSTKVAFRVRPVPKKVKQGDAEVDVFSPTLWTPWTEYKLVKSLDAPGSPSVKLDNADENSDKTKLVASLTGLDKEEVTTVYFKLVKNGNESSGTQTIEAAVDDTGEVSATFSVDAGASYKVCCKAQGHGIESEWGPFSGALNTKPAKVEFTETTPQAKSSTSIYVAWNKSDTATSYIVEHTDDKDGFYEGTQITSVTTEKLNLTVNDLAKGTTYHFRVKATNDENQESAWSEVKTAVIGTAPSAPTTWSSTTTAIAGEGETVSLYWVHNATDGATQQSAEVTLTFEGVDDIALIKEDVSVGLGKITETKVDGYAVTYTIEAATDEVNVNATHSLIIDTKNYDDGAKITWKVSTTGSTGMVSESSMDRVIHIYSMPGILMSVSDSTNALGATYYKVDYLTESDVYVKTPDTIEMVNGSPVSGKFTVTGEQVRTYELDEETVYYCVVEKSSLNAFPFTVNVSVETNMTIQKPIEYHLTVTANEQYETIDNFGNPKTVIPEEMLYSKHFTADKDTNTLSTEISAQDVNLDNGQSYTVKCLVSMDSGITVEAFTEISVAWEVTSYTLNAEIGLDRGTCSTFIRPYCVNAYAMYYHVNKSGALYILDKTLSYSYVYGFPIKGALTTTNDQVHTGTTPDGDTVYYSVVIESTPVTDVWLGVYRREYDGTFTEIESGLDAANKSFVTDPHPSLDYGRYRITAKDKTTGRVSFADIVEYPIGEKAIIIQWKEPHSSYLVSTDEMELSNSSETFLRLPYNIDVANSRDPDVSLVKYIGRKHPVSYYGTQVGEKATWSATVPKTDTETLYTLQRLQAWSGDAYVREPSGTGYWANVKVTMSKTHLETVVPVSLEITRVEGGV